MRRVEQAFALVTDDGVTTEAVASGLGIGHSKARQYLGELVGAGRIARARVGHATNRYFLTAEAAQSFQAQDRGARVLAAISENGATTKELAARIQMDKTNVQTAIHNLLKAGKVHSGRIGHRTVRYFLTKEAADKFAERGVVVRVSALPPTVQFRASTFEKGAQIIVPPHVQKQECPPFRGLGFSETQPKELAFSSLGVGRYLPDEDAMLRRLARKGA